MTLEKPPRILQGGMGVAVSGWRLARAVSLRGELGVVSGTALDTLLVRRLQDGDVGGHLRRAMESFPLPRVAAETLKRFFRPGGRVEGEPYALLPLYRHTVDLARERLQMLAAFVEVELAKEGHGGRVGINLLTKIQFPNLPLLYGAMLAGVDCVVMGAGIPREIPGALDALARGKPAALRLDVEGATTPVHVEFDPALHGEGGAREIPRPDFLAIVSSHSLASMLARKSTGKVNGLVVEGPTAGGHNAPPRGEMVLNGRGEPVYGTRDAVDLRSLGELGLPFWLAGGQGRPRALREALEAGAAGIQVGTLFAFCEESGFAPELKRTVLKRAAAGDIDVHTDPRASPTGFPFKVVTWDGGREPSRERRRMCDLGYLRTAFALAGASAEAGASAGADTRVGFRCPAESIERYRAAGGDPADTAGRACLCNGLIAAAGMAQPRDQGDEPPIVTSGDDLVSIARFLGGRTSYVADDVLDYLRGPEPAALPLD